MHVLLVYGGDMKVMEEPKTRRRSEVEEANRRIYALSPMHERCIGFVL